eukprot:5945290-Prymnesium_polylepis.1
MRKVRVARCCAEGHAKAKHCVAPCLRVPSTAVRTTGSEQQEQNTYATRHNLPLRDIGQERAASIAVPVRPKPVTP